MMTQATTMAQVLNQKEYRRLEKLEALALRGEGGEKETAQKKYDELRRKLDDEATAAFKPNAGDDFETQLIKEQIMLNMEGCKTCAYGRANGAWCTACDTMKEVERLKDKLT